jgi:hypothetical protein
MARGWESKSVEGQQEAAEGGRAPVDQRPAATAEDRERAGLELALADLRQRLASARDPRHVQLLEQSLAAVQGRLAALPPRRF